MSRMWLIVPSVLGASVLSLPALAAEVKLDTRSCYAGPIHTVQHSEGIVSGSYAVVGMLPGSENIPAPLQMMSARCLGQFSIIAGALDEHGTCEAVNAGGGKMFWVYARSGDPTKAEGTWHMVHGTGDLADITGDGKFMPIGVFPPVAPDMTTVCNHEWGTLNLE